MKKVLALLIVLTIICIAVCSCKTNRLNNQTNGSEQKKDVPSLYELEQMYKQAYEYENNAKFKSAIQLYRQLYEYKYPDPDFESQGLDGAIKIREVRYLHQKILCMRCAWMAKNLKNQLKDPNSLVIYSIKFSYNGENLVITFDYGAKNSFGGMVRDYYSETYSLWDEEKKEVYEASKEHMDSLGLTEKDVARYLSGNAFFGKETQLAAIANGTSEDY